MHQAQNPMLELKNISKTYKNFSLQNINLKIESGEYFVLLGRSGSGKSLILEIISGFKSADSGEILLNDKNIENLKIQDRKIGLVFQDYAAFPHKTVFENIAFPLKNKKSKTEIAQTVEKLASEMNISNILNQKPGLLSGGELQRMVIARTLASEPEILLLDEPLSSLDVQLRSEIRVLLKELNRSGITIIHITHDPDEAVRLADRLAVINKGKILQIGTPKEVLSKPQSKFTANFAGISNFFGAKLISENGKQTKNAIVKENLTFEILTDCDDGEGFVIIRSDDVLLTTEHIESSARNNFKGLVYSVSPVILGMEVVVDIGIKIAAHVTEKSVETLKIKEGNEIWISFKASAVQFLRN